MQSILQSIAIIVLLSVGLVACSNEHHETANATEVVELAQNNAEALAPVAEPIQFDDESLPKIGSTTDTSTADTSTTDTSTTDKADSTNNATTDQSQTTTNDNANPNNTTDNNPTGEQ